MKTISGLGIGLSLVCVFLLLALVAEVGYAKELIQLFCFKKPEANNGGREVEISRKQDLELGFEAELMKLHNHRLLFTIIEETKADLESDDGKSRLGSRSRTRSLSDLPLGVNDCTTPGFTPLASPATLTSSPLESYSHHGFNPLFESDGELEFNKFFRSSSSSSPPPKFKFLRDSAVTEGSFLKFMNPAMMNREEKQSSEESDETVSFCPSSSCTNLRTLDQRSTLVV
ncbi:hypothetical protein Bca52824_057252 [Brassica carinata]|uniref:Uncharacterized protein n=1 Tax=Brassica carinata TaxID=52824 RepID=A0A8X7UDH8_BRACI|nr:hypothetical protein Bca52824_057252 [Brassica carinata]